MGYVWGAALIAVAIYIIFAWKQDRWPFGSSWATASPNSRQDAIIETLKYETRPVPGVFPHVRSQAPLSNEVRQGIIDAFVERTAKARVLGWKDGFDPAEYTILVFPSVRDHNPDGTYSPVFQVFIDAGSWYDGSEYDQDPASPGGYIFAAEQVLTRGSELTNTFVIAASDDGAYTQRVVSYALDHLFAAKNDRALYEATKDHSKSGGHPLW
jgi:hypothetical protein